MHPVERGKIDIEQDLVLAEQQDAPSDAFERQRRSPRRGAWS